MTPEHLVPIEPAEAVQAVCDAVAPEVSSYGTRLELQAFRETRTPHDCRRLVNALRNVLGREDLAAQVEALLNTGNERTRKIRTLNDTARDCLCSLGTGVLVITDGVQALPEADRQTLLGKVVEFKDFNDDNDPHGEHDFGKIEHNGTDYYWKIDYYDKAREYGSEDPSDPKQTTRVLTVLRADEY